MTVWNQVTIVGVGLMGGSIGLGLRKRGLAKQVVGFGRDQKILDQAIKLGAITQGELSLSQAVEAAELVVVCTPVDLIVEQVREVSRLAPKTTLITDVGSTKQQIVQELNGSGKGIVPQFVGSHPLAGSEQSGVESAIEDLLANRVVVVTPVEESDPRQLDRVIQFWESLEAKVVKMSAEQHDLAMAEISHLPHLLSSAIAASTNPEFLSLAATGWLDTTRIAAGSPELWVEILLQNRDKVLHSLAQFESTIESIRTALENQDRSSLLQQLEKGKYHRDAVGS